MDYTKIFTRAIENKSKYEFRSVELSRNVQSKKTQNLK